MPRGDNMRRPTEERFWEKVDRSEDCWAWLGALNNNGYGSLWDGTRNVRAHRYSYELLVGPIPEGLQIDHLCRNRACVNPDHLEPVTNLVNAQRGEAGWHMRDKMPDLTHCPKGHEYVEENIRQRTSKEGRVVRHCWTCERERRSRQIACPECGETMRRSSLSRHQHRRHAAKLDATPASTEDRADNEGTP